MGTNYLRYEHIHKLNPRTDHEVRISRFHCTCKLKQSHLILLTNHDPSQVPLSLVTFKMFHAHLHYSSALHFFFCECYISLTASEMCALVDCLSIRCFNLSSLVKLYCLVQREVCLSLLCVCVCAQP